MKLLIATKNRGKLKEMRQFLGNRFELVSLDDFPDAPDVPETGKTFQLNALLKARTYHEWSGLPTVADDGGLEIDALGGEPGVYSRRWPGHEASDEELIDLALQKLSGIPAKQRTARLTAAGAYWSVGSMFTFQESIHGSIAERRPDRWEQGYPFRAIFIVTKFGKLLRDLMPKEHEAVNHRLKVYSQIANCIRIVSPA